MWVQPADASTCVTRCILGSPETAGFEVRLALELARIGFIGGLPARRPMDLTWTNRGGSPERRPQQV
jgi:hypothetical protein